MNVLAMAWGEWLLALVILGVSGLLMLVILLQRGRGGGLAGAFGGAGGTAAFGAKTGDVFTWITVVVATLFVLLNVCANYVFDQSATLKAQAATATPASPDTRTLTATPIPITPDGAAGPEGSGITVTTEDGSPLPPGAVQIVPTPVAPGELPPGLEEAARKKAEEAKPAEAKPAEGDPQPAPEKDKEPAAP
ncbi:MAG: preprotein translocase subunit SecG [Planctomycetes bacterium]|nr:preprotein translocase subunit SecG [Planctomycetota bacterium]